MQDATFDGDGVVIVPGGCGGTDYASSLKIQSNGGLVVGGYATDIDGKNQFAVARITGLADKSVELGTPLNYTATFINLEGGPLSYSAALAGGAPLPAWLAFQTSSGEFTGTPAQADVTRYDINVTAASANIWGAAASDIFNLAITNMLGTSGNDTLYGGLGSDTMAGLAGNDTYTIDQVSDSVGRSAELRHRLGAAHGLVKPWTPTSRTLP